MNTALKMLLKPGLPILGMLGLGLLGLAGCATPAPVSDAAPAANETKVAQPGTFSARMNGQFSTIVGTGNTR